MLRTILIAIALLLAVGVASAADQSVKGYIRKDGTYVQPYHRTAPNNNLYDNYSSQGNTNPWMGKQGSEHNEFSNPPAYNQSSPLYTPPMYTPPKTAPLYNPYSYPPKSR
jgi:hypothetical protein